jgi:tetratricopeptide (TPR) repeat protein
MQDKKKKSTYRRMNESQNSKTPESKSGAARTAVSTRSGAAAVTQPLTGEKQFSAFEAAMKLFHARKLKEARELYVQALAGPGRDIAHRAELHIAMCDRRLQQAKVALDSAEDHYNYAIAMINARNLAPAKESLEAALKLEPESDHVLYALALAQALSGELPAAVESLKRAIDLEPRNRIAARQDADFAPFANQPPFDALLFPEKKGW